MCYKMNKSIEKLIISCLIILIFGNWMNNSYIYGSKII